MTDEEEADAGKVFVMLQVATWIRATIFQGHRLLAASSDQFAPQKYDRMTTVMEEEFFVVAARRLLRWIAEASAQSLIPDDAFRQFREFDRVVVDVRDMREHADDYVVRKRGKRQPDFHHSQAGEGGKASYVSDATATIVLDDNYMIGGRLSVQRTLDAVDQARSDFVAIVRNDQRFSWLAVTLKS